MNCPECDTQLICADIYGFYKGRGHWDKNGDIYKCQNEDCDYFDEYFYTDKLGGIRYGYPC